MRFKCRNTHITCIVIVLIILLLSPMFFFKNQSPYMLMEGMKNNNKKEGLTSKSTSKPTSTPSASTPSASTLSTLTTPSTSTPSTSTTEGFANIEGSNNPSIFSMLFFKNTKFKPKCCPSSYSTSSGCACTTNSQYKYIMERGGNNIPFSEY